MLCRAPPAQAPPQLPAELLGERRVRRACVPVREPQWGGFRKRFRPVVCRGGCLRSFLLGGFPASSHDLLVNAPPVGLSQIVGETLFPPVRISSN